MIIKGKVWKFGDNVDTDVICPGSYIHLPASEIMPHAFEAIRPGFHKLVDEGDVIVGGKGFGIGSSRECAVAVLKEMGISACIVESAGRIFFRNCIALGIPIIVQKGISKHFNEGDIVEIRLDEGKIINLVTNTTLKFPPFPPMILHIIQNGGLRPIIRRIIQSSEGEE